MTIYIPSYHKEDRKISPLLDRKESKFIIRSFQEKWYKENFPNSQILPVIEDSAPTGNPGLVIARQWIINNWRANAPDNEEFAWMIDDDWTGFTLNLGEGVKRTHPSLDEAYEFLLSKTDPYTRIIGPTNSNSEMAFNHEIIRTNKGEAPESCYLISKKCIGDYRALTFESQYYAAKQIMNNGNFKTVHALQLDYTNDQTISTIFNDSDYIEYSKMLCNNTIDEFPPLMYEVIIGKQGTHKVKWNGLQKERGLNAFFK